MSRARLARARSAADRDRRFRFRNRCWWESGAAFEPQAGRAIDRAIDHCHPALPYWPDGGRSLKTKPHFETGDAPGRIARGLAIQRFYRAPDLSQQRLGQRYAPATLTRLPAATGQND